MFLLCESSSGLVIIDQHAAAERVTFARYRAAYLTRSVASQRLLVPSPFTVDAEDAAFIEEGSEAIEAAGLEVRVVGPTQGLVTSVPQLLGRADPARLARDLLDEARRAGGRGFSDAIDRALATMACHGSIRAGDVVSSEEASSLLHALDEVDFGGHCPHGRPLLMRIRYDELERLVGRR
jgi:DNA mismatch repair protein MutL